MFELNSTLWTAMQVAVKKKSERVQYSSCWRQIASAFHFNDILASLAQDNLVSEDVQSTIKYLAQKKVSIKQQHLLVHNIVLRLIKI